MANVQKYTRADVKGGGLIQHLERAKDENGEYHKWGNQEIDSSRSHLNYNLAPDRGVGGGIGADNGVGGDMNVELNNVGGQWGFIQKRLSEVYCHNREDVNIMCSWIITAPKSIFSGWGDGSVGGVIKDTDSDSTDKYLDPEINENLHKFFSESYKFLNDKYGDGTDKNVVSAYVHMDETTPHLHYAFIPVVWDKKKNREKVSAKESLGWADRDLNKFHPQLEAHMKNVFGFELGILNEATKDGNKTVTELKRMSALNEQQEIKINIDKDSMILDKLQASITQVKIELNELELLTKNTKNELENNLTKISDTRVILNDTLNALEIAQNELEIVRGDIYHVRSQKEAEIDLKRTEIEMAVADIKSKAEIELESVLRPIGDKIAQERLINAIFDSGKQTTNILGQVKTRFTFDGSLEVANRVFDAARDRDDMLKRKNLAIKERDGALVERDIAAKERNRAVSRMRGIEERERNVSCREK